MKNTLLTLLLLSPLVLEPAYASQPTTIDAGNHLAYGANVGWVEWRGDVTHGAVIGDYACSGLIYSANAGWINLGSGAPTNGIRYQNDSSADFGVNHDGLGNLSGLAWGANVGWISFEATGAPMVDLLTGNLSGYVYGANVGWISLSNATAYVQTDSLYKGPDTDANGLPDPWEWEHFGHIGVDPTADPDHDGASNLAEYLAGSDPNNISDSLHITLFIHDATMNNTLKWSTLPTRLYAVQRNAAITNATLWSDWQTSPTSLGWGKSVFSDTNSNAFYRVRAYRPLMP